MYGRLAHTNASQLAPLDPASLAQDNHDVDRNVRVALPKRAASVVTEIKVQSSGPVTTAVENAVVNMETRVGQPYDVKSVEADIRNLSAIRNVTNVRIFGEPATDGLRAIVVIQTKAATVP